MLYSSNSLYFCLWQLARDKVEAVLKLEWNSLPSCLLKSAVIFTFFCVDCSLIASGQSESHEGFFSKQELVQIWFCCGIAASLQQFPVTLCKCQRHLLAAVGVTVWVWAEVVPHCLGGVGGEAEMGLCCRNLGAHFCILQSRVAGQSGPREAGSLHDLPARLWLPPLVEPGIASLLRRLALPEQGQRWSALLVKQRWR